MHPLANDENGHPIDVPAQAAGWLVKRHGGGKGRPGAVYDGEGRPLVVPLDATAADLRAATLSAGMYRLEAVDAGRRPVGATAYTEIAAVADGDAMADLKPTTPQDAFLLSVARTIEATQRLQAERERQLTEILKHAIDRIGTGGGGSATASGITWKDLDDYDRRKARAVEEEIARRNAATPAPVASASEAEGGGWIEPILKECGPALVNKALTAIDVLLAWAMARRQPAPVAQAAASPPSVEPAPVAKEVHPATSASAAAVEPQAPVSAESRDAPSGAIEPPPEIKDKFDRVCARLTSEEQALVDEALPRIPDHLRNEFGRTIVLMPDDEAIAYLRTHVFPNIRRWLGKAD
jgi:hypothetical protein